MKKLKKSDKKTLSPADKEGFFSEVEERRIHARNVIIYDFFNESEGVDDLETLNSIFTSVKEFPLVISTRRFEKAREDDGAQLIKVTFLTDSNVLFVLCNKSKLGKTKLLIKNYLTPSQLNHLKELIEEIDKRVGKVEKNLKIRYIKSFSTIIKVKKKSEK